MRVQVVRFPFVPFHDNLAQRNAYAVADGMLVIVPPLAKPALEKEREAQRVGVPMEHEEQRVASRADFLGVAELAQQLLNDRMMLLDARHGLAVTQRLVERSGADDVRDH